MHSKTGHGNPGNGSFRVKIFGVRSHSDRHDSVELPLSLSIVTGIWIGFTFLVVYMMMDVDRGLRSAVENGRIRLFFINLFCTSVLNH